MAFLDPVPQLSPAEIRSFRQRLNMSEAEFARWVGLAGTKAKDTVHKWEQGKLVPSEMVMRKIHKAMQ